MPYQPTGIKVDVVLSGRHTTTVKPLAGGQTTIILSGVKANVFPQSGVEVCAQLPGMQGPAGSNTQAQGAQGSIQYNDGGLLAGANKFFYDDSSDKISISGGALVINNGQFIISGNENSPFSFLIKDGSTNIINIDAQNKKILFSENASASEYYIGIGTDQPQERLHIQNGNLRIDGDVILSGNMLPKEGGKFSLGSPSKPFKDLYLAGDSVVFPSQESKLEVTDNSITFKRNIYSDSGPEDLFKVSKVGETTVISGITLMDSVMSDLTYTSESIPYGAIESGGAFAAKRIPAGSTDVFMYFGKDLGYTPRVVCTLISPPNTNDMYFFVIENIKTSGCDVLFSSTVENEGYEIQCFASARTGENYFVS